MWQQIENRYALFTAFEQIGAAAAALDMARVAAGQCDGAFDQGLNAWDVAAGSLLITEAGGCIGNFLGAPDFLESREYMAAGPRPFAEMGAALRCYSRFDR